MKEQLQIDYIQWVNDLRQTAEERYRALKWPARNEDAWRRSRIHDLDLEAYQSGLPLGDEPGALDLQDYGLTINVGRGKAVLHCQGECPRGIHAYALHEPGEYEQMEPALKDQVRHILSRGVEDISHKLQARHYAELSEVLVLAVDTGFSYDKPVLLQYTDSNKVNHPHIIMIAGEASVMRLDILYKSPASGSYLTNAVLELIAGADSDIRVSQTQLRNTDSLFFQQNRVSLGENTMLHYQDNHFGSDYARVDSAVSLQGKGSRAELSGLYFAGRDQLIDIHLLQDHQSEGAYSRAYYKGVSSLNGRSVFEGLIRVEPGARQTDAYLSNKNLLLNTGAGAVSMPQLKIQNNDVKCSHGSTTSKINEDHLFYLQSRGFSREEAVNTLTTAFFGEILDQSTPWLAEQILDVIAQKMADRRV